jgi:hypothetical protein
MTDTDMPVTETITDERPFVGQFVRKQGNFGTVAVVGRMDAGYVETLADPKRLFPKDGLIETQGVIHARLSRGDWVEFDLVRNSRPRAPAYLATHLRRLARYAVLPESTVAGYRGLLTKDGWCGESRPGLWALRTTGDRLLVVNLELGKDGSLRIPRKLASEIYWTEYRDDLIVQLPVKGGTEQVFVGDLRNAGGTYDWSEEADHVARVIRSLSDANDPRLADLIAWLELHHEEGTGRVFAAAADHEAAESALRSGELAERLRADRDLMAAYVEAAQHDDAVREAVRAWAREGHGIEAARLREELDGEIANRRARLEAELLEEIARKQSEAFATVTAGAEAAADARRAQIERNAREAESAMAERTAALDKAFAEKRAQLEAETARHQKAVDHVAVEAKAAQADLDQVRANDAEARERLAATVAEIDRLLAIGGRLDSAAPSAATTPSGISRTQGVRLSFQEWPLSPVIDKAQAIGHQVFLTDDGKSTMRRFATLLLAGELPILTGDDTAGLLRLAEALFCPGRSAVVEADPTIISIDDLWARPGSGAPTALALAAEAAVAGGAVLVTIRGIERSGSRFWLPALADALRRGSLPRGLLVCCTIDDPRHEEVAALPKDIQTLEVRGAIVEDVYLAGPTLLSPPKLELTALDPGPTPGELSTANGLLATLGFKLSLDQGMRVARMFVEATALFGDDTVVRTVVEEIAREMASKAGPSES